MPIVVGTGLWVIGFILVAIIAPEEHRTWLMLTCAIGVVLGAIGLAYTRRRARRIKR